jgi:surface polysaccharide O-acyltransferase-like enzyme
MHSSHIVDNYNKYDWMDWLRGYAILMVIFNHWIYYLYKQTDITFVDKLVGLICIFSGNSIHLFFVLSGAGLAISFFTKPVQWNKWFIKKMQKIIVPFWIAVIVTYAIINCSHYFIPSFIKDSFDIKVLISYITLTRNFYEPGVNFYPSLWFIPNIVGLYFVFPILITFFSKMNKVGFLFITICISYCSILLFMLMGMSLSHQNSVFLFFLFEFAFGIYIGYRAVFLPINESRKKMILLLLLGFLFYSISYYLVKKTIWGGNFSKPFTSLGLFFITIPLFFWISRLFPMLFKYFKKVSSASYYMYLIHAPIVLYFLGPFKDRFSDNISIRLPLFIITYIIFCWVVYSVSIKAEYIVKKFVKKVTMSLDPILSH